MGADSELVLGKHSGKAAFKKRLQTLGYSEIAQDDAQLETLVREFKTLADQKKHVTDADIEALIVRRGARRALRAASEGTGCHASKSIDRQI